MIGLARSRSASLVAAATRYLPSGAAVARAQPSPSIRAIRSPSASLVAAATRHAGGVGRRGGFVFPSGGKGNAAPFSSSSSPKDGEEEKLDRVLQILDKLSNKNTRRSPTFIAIVIVSGVVGVVAVDVLYTGKRAEENRERLKPINYVKHQIHLLSRDDQVREDVNFLVEKAADKFVERLYHRMNPFNWDIWGSEKVLVVPIESDWVAKVFFAANIVQAFNKRGTKLNAVPVQHLLMGYMNCEEKLVMEILEVLVSIGFLKRSSDKKESGHIFEISKKYRNSELGADKDFLNKIIEAEKAGKK